MLILRGRVLIIRGLSVVIIAGICTLLALSMGCDDDSGSYGLPQVRFPQDEGSHPEFQSEWWYANFNLTDSEGRKYSAMVSYFTPALKVISISDLESQVFYHEVYGSHPFSGGSNNLYRPDYAEGSLDLRWGGTDHWFRTDTDTLSYHLEANGTDIGLNLNFVSVKPPLMVGGDGLVEWVHGSSYYYSLTRLQVEGQIKLQGQLIDVTGIGWMDHQWMDSMSGMGWEWFSAQLDNDTELIFWQIVNPDESIESLDLTIMFPDNSIYHTGDLELEKLSSWISPQSGREYGINWRVREKDRDLDLELIAHYPEQEIKVFEVPTMGLGFYFWEGAMTVAGQLDGEAVSGVGYAELVRPPGSTADE